MAKYIDKSTLVAEIERRKQELHPTDTHKMQVGEKIDRDVLMWLNALTFVKKVIDTLEVKEVDLDREITQFLDTYFPNVGIGHKLSLRRTAKHFFELGLKTKKED